MSAGRTNLKILMLLNRVPYPQNDGGAIAMYAAVNGYIQNGCEVHVLAMNTSKHFVAESKVNEVFRFAQKVDTVFVNNRIRVLPAFLNLFSSQSFVLYRFLSSQFQEKLIATLEKENFDVVHIDTLSCMLYAEVVRKHSSAKLLYRAHNIEYQIWQRAATNESNFLKRTYLSLQSSRLKKFEDQIVSKPDLILAISKEDESAFRKIVSVPVVYLPAGMQVDDEIPVSQKSTDLFFIGSFDWLPNLQGIEWFFDQLWPSIQKAIPDLRFFIAGKKMPTYIKEKASENVVAVGEVPDSKQFMLDHGIMVVPLVSGSGVRIKIVEAMALGKVVVATTIAAEGLGLINNEHILIADTAEQFSAQLLICQNQNFLEQMGTRAHKFALENFQNKRIFEKLVNRLKNL